MDAINQKIPRPYSPVTFERETIDPHSNYYNLRRGTPPAICVRRFAAVTR